MEMKFDDDGNLVRWYGQPILLDASVPRSPEFLKLLDKYQPTIDMLSNQIVGETKTILDNNCRHSECNFGNLIADAFIYNHLKNYTGPYWTDASIALINSGAIRAPAAIGNITNYDLITILPFSSTLYILNVTGHVLKLALERSIERYGNSGEFLQVSGLQITYDLMRNEGQRVVSVNVLCRECFIPTYDKLDINKIYGIITTSFIYNGGNAFDMFQVNEHIRLLACLLV